MARTAAPRTFGDQLRILRKRARLSQRDLGIATHYSEGQICRFERGAKPPDLSTLVAMFVPALGLDESPEDVSVLLERAAEARGESLQDRVVEGGSARAPRLSTRSSVLPDSHNPLVGREEDTARLVALLNKRGVRLVSVLGPPGVGKTRLALAVAQQMREQFDEGEVFVALAGVAHADDVPDAIAQAMGVLPAPGETARAALPALLRDKHTLLVLDNIEHVIAIAPWLDALVAGAPALRIMLTSRVALRIREEQQYTLSPLALPALSPLPALPDLAGVPSVALYEQCAQLVQPAFALDEHNALAVAALCHRLDGLPLAIEMAAARSRLFSPQALLKRLAGVQRDPLRWLEQGRAGGQARHASLQHAVQWSFDLLDEADQRAFAGLGVFADGFDDVAALRVAGCTPEQLQRLADVSLIQVVAAGDAEPRFRLLETLRAFAGTMLSQGGALEVNQSALLDWAVALAEEAEPHLTQGDAAAWMTRLNTERMNWLSALAFAAQAGHALRGMRLANALWRYWLNHGLHAEGQRWLSEMLDTLPTDDTSLMAQRARARGWFGRGAMKYRQGDPQGGLADARVSEQRWQMAGDDAGLATTLNLIGVILADTSQFAEAEAIHQRVLALRRGMGDRWGEATSLSNLGVVARHQAAFDRAEQYYRAALAIRREMRDATTLALTLSNLGDVLHSQGRYAEAMGHYLESLHLRREMDDRHGVAHVLTNIGVLRLYAGDVDAGERDMLESVRLTREVGDRLAESNAEIDLGMIAMLRGQAGAALHHYGQGLALAEAVHNPAQVALAQTNLVEALLLSRQHQRAWQMGVASLRYYHDAGIVAGCADALEALALCAAAGSDCETSWQWAEAALRKREEIGVPRTPYVRDMLKRTQVPCGTQPAALSFEAAIADALTKQRMDLA